MSCAMACPSGTELSSPLMRHSSPHSRATARHSLQPTRNREFRLPARHSASGGTRIRSCSVPAAAALSSSALKQVGVGVRKPRHSFDFSPKPEQPAPLPPCAALLRPLGCTAGVASSRLPRSEPSQLRSLSFLPPLSSVLLVTHPLCTSCWRTHAGCRHPSTAASQPAQRRLPCTGTLTFAVVKRCVGKKMLRSLVACLRQVGLVLNASKTTLMTTQAQPPDRVWLHADIYIDVVHGSSSHKWLGCQLSMDGDQTADFEFHLHAAARAFWANKWILCDKHVPLSLRVKFFEAVVTPVACFGAGHRKISQPHLRKFDSEWRRLLRSMVGPPSGLDWSMPWHEVLHSWNQYVQQMTQPYSCRAGLANASSRMGTSHTM